MYAETIQTKKSLNNNYNEMKMLTQFFNMYCLLLKLLQNLKYATLMVYGRRVFPARHDVKCYICKEYPIVGLRYRCLQCFNVDMCFQCFTRIPTYGKHDKSHAIEEYCVPVSGGRLT